MRFITRITILAIAIGVLMLIIQISLGVFFKTTETLNDLTYGVVLKLLVESSLIAAIAILVTLLIHYFRPRKIESNFGKTVPTLSVFTKVIVVFLGLPLFGLLLSMVPLRLFEILSFSVEPKLTVVVFTLCFWAYALFKLSNSRFWR